MSDTSMNAALLASEQDERLAAESDNDVDVLSVGSSESDDIAIAFRQVAAEKARRRANGGDEEDEDEEMDDGYDTDDIEADARYSDPVRKWRNKKDRKARSPLFIKLYNDVAALTPRGSDVIRAGLGNIRTIIERYRKLKPLRSLIESFCILALRFWKLVATHEATTGHRNQTATPVSFFLTITVGCVSRFVNDVSSKQYSTLVSRSRYLDDTRTVIVQRTARLELFTSGASSFLDLRSKSPLPSGGTDSFLGSDGVRRYFAEQVTYAFARLRLLADPKPPEVPLLVELNHLLQNIDFSDDNGDDEEANTLAHAAEETGSLNESEHAEALASLVQSVHARINESVLDIKGTGPTHMWFTRSFTDVLLSIRIGVNERIFEFPEQHELLFAIFSIFAQIGFYHEASVIGELLVMRLRFLADTDQLGSVHQRQRKLCSALAALSKVLVEAGRPIEAAHAADEAVKISEQIQDGADGSPNENMLQARVFLQQSQAHLATDNYDLECSSAKPLQRSIELFRTALTEASSSIEDRFVLANAVETLAAHEYFHGDRTAFREEAIVLYRQLAVEKPMLFKEKLANLLAEHASRTRNNAESLIVFEEAVQLYDRLVATELSHRQRLIKTCHEYANELNRAHQYRRALEMLNKAISICDTPDYKPTHHEFGGEGNVHHMLIRRAAVCINLERYESGMDSIARVENLIKCKTGGDFSSLSKEVRHYKATCQLMLGHADDAAANLDKTIEAEKRKEARSFCGGIEGNVRYIQAMGELGAAQCHLGNLELAMQTGKEAVRLTQKTKSEFWLSKASLLRLNVRNRVFYAATLLEAGHHEDAQQQLDEALKIFAGGCEGMGRVEKTARVIRARALEAAGQAEEAAAERVRAEAMPFEGFAHRLVRSATG